MSLLLFSAIIFLSLLWAAAGIGHQRLPSSVTPVPSSSPKEEGRIAHPISPGVPHFEKIVDGKYIEYREAHRFFYTVDPALQMSVNEILHSYRPPYSAFVAIDPKTGRILALADYARENPWNAGVWQRATYPAASIFKLVTAASVPGKRTSTLQFAGFLSGKSVSPRSPKTHGQSQARSANEF
ncbi:MAG: hypothetical protein NTY64_21770 [Deltaproteobacteria bacterium]|nr:hypothetical protein [Deltaproteobacteria bacterium]